MPQAILRSFSEDDIRATQPALKIGLLATVTPEGLPHVTMLSTLMACGPAQLSFGQFTEGRSKSNLGTWSPNICPKMSRWSSFPGPNWSNISTNQA